MQYMNIKYGVPFWIPRRLGDKFRDIISIKGVKYIKGSGFVIENKEALDSVNKILVKMGLILKPTINCYICGVEINCDECEFNRTCHRAVQHCICKVCFIKEDLVNRYLIKQSQEVSRLMGH